MRSVSTDAADGLETVHLQHLEVSVRISGSGSPILLLHGFPHTKELWEQVTPLLVDAGHQVVAPDLRGIGGSGRTESGYDAVTLADDQVQLLDALGLEAAHVVGFDFGAAPAFAMAASHPDRVRSLTVVEAVVGGLPGAKAFLAAGVPWWFGFHQVPGLAEDVVVGEEDRYIRFFLGIGSRTGVPEGLVRRFVDAYTGRERLRAAFEHYRAMPRNAAANRAWADEDGALRIPVTAVGASTVQDAPARQLERVASDFAEHLLPDSGHIVPIDAPDELAAIVTATAARAVPSAA